MSILLTKQERLELILQEVCKYLLKHSHTIYCYVLNPDLYFSYDFVFSKR